MNQHPPEYTKPTDRFVVMMQVGMQTKGGGPAFEPLSYGLPGQPAPEQLLRRGQRGAAFPSEEAARKAVKAAAKQWEKSGTTFHYGKQIAILKVEES